MPSYLTAEQGAILSKILIVLSIIIAVISIIIVIRNHIKTNNFYSNINNMIDKAIDGTFTESIFDETLFSATENKLWQYLTAAESSSKSVALEKDKIKTLISDISHQTKTPLSNILLYTELLGEQNLSDEASQYIVSLNSQAEKMNFLISSLVKLSRLETGILKLNPAENNIDNLLENIEMQFNLKSKEKGLYLNIIKSDVKIKAVFDEKWTSEAVNTIVDNAIKYTKNGGIIVRALKYEMFVCIEISDTGIGIPENEQSKVFMRFYRSMQSAASEGVGIGLYLAREIISEENGYIKLSSEVGKGTVFSIYLPSSR